MGTPYAGTLTCVAPGPMDPREHSHETHPIQPSPPATEDRVQQSAESAPLSSVACQSVSDCQFMSAQSPENYALLTQSSMLVKSEQQQFWPSPPLGPWDFEHESCSPDVPEPPAGAFAHQYAGTPISPDSWSSVEAALLIQDDKFANQRAPDACEVSAGLCSPPSTSSSSLGISTYSRLPQLPLGMEASGVDALSPEELFIDTTPSVLMSREGSPPRNVYDVPNVHCLTPRDSSVESSTTEGKLDEPYAKLIYRAFMSRPDYAMSLQDIYQWFRDHTTKAVSAKGGWQNSIRHNLSMNAAFTKRHRKEDEREYSSSLEEAKRTNEWVLENWAVFHGVQSTTRYRKGNSRRRTGGATPASQSSGRPTQHSAKRAMSGRKGGCAARDSRLRGRAFYHGKPGGRASRCGLEQGRFSPPRSIHPDFYTPAAMTMSHLEAAARRHATSTQRGYHGSRPHGAPDTMDFSLAVDEHDLALGASSAHDAMAGTPWRGDTMSATYALPAQNGFVYGIRDVHMGYLGEQQMTEESSSSSLFGSMDDGVYGWSDGSD